MIVQIYEVQTPAEAEMLIELGVDHIGSVIVSADDWKVPAIKETIAFVSETSSKSSLIPLFSNQDDIFHVLDHYQPDIVHFCEDLVNQGDIKACCEKLALLQEAVKSRFPLIKIMRSIPIPPTGAAAPISAIELARHFEPVSDFFLTDTVFVKAPHDSQASQPVCGFVGITGQICDWNMAQALVAATKKPVILAGGLAPINVYQAAVRIQPAGVDSCTQTNAQDDNGQAVRFKKDVQKVRRFIKEARKAESDIRRMCSNVRLQRFEKRK